VLLLRGRLEVQVTPVAGQHKLLRGRQVGQTITWPGTRRVRETAVQVVAGARGGGGGVLHGGRHAVAERRAQVHLLRARRKQGLLVPEVGARGQRGGRARPAQGAELVAGGRGLRGGTPVLGALDDLAAVAVMGGEREVGVEVSFTQGERPVGVFQDLGEEEEEEEEGERGTGGEREREREMERKEEGERERGREGERGTGGEKERGRGRDGREREGERVSIILFSVYIYITGVVT